MGQLRDKVGTGVIAGEKLNELFEYAKENQFALPAVNVTSSSSINAVIETAVKVNAPVIVQFSNGGGVRWEQRRVEGRWRHRPWAHGPDATMESIELGYWVENMHLYHESLELD